ncbi:protein containing prepilin-type N- cleavage/methylation domain protein [bacterium]|nr:protein containing prepilin-type N- cleavage/methylation domain protein [bacterium]MBU1433991.1 protein containing prepilin-type N- cleavage/methylation domain protein [bacterium]MBU1502973.1 protein containing prepilin-type N- cleavage/methylation domain protein [bacterium]
MKRSAFTMLELIFAIVVMGVIGKFGVEFLAQSYRTFIQAKINNELHSNSANTLQFIAKRLESRIQPSVIKRIAGGAGFAGATQLVANPDSYNVLEWISYDIDGFRGAAAPLWSGIVDLDPAVTTLTNIQSPNTNTAALNTLIGVLSNNGSTIANTAIMFSTESYSPNSFGWAGGDALIDQSRAIHPINATANPNQFTSSIAGVNFNGMKISNRYMLAWTAYAVVHDGVNLRFYYDYQPWQGENYLNGKNEILMQNINTFRIRTNPSGGIFSIMVCANSTLIVGEAHAICKEKVIF